MKFFFYRADSKYCDFLRTTDKCVPYTMDKKASRPFVGIILDINGFHYYAPLTSPKPKHLKMKNQVDFIKIKEGIWGAINLNNMIPIHASCLQKVDMKILPSDNKEEIDYKNLLQNQLSWCNAHRDMIIHQANKLYYIICEKKGRAELISRCCNFPLNEQQYLIYNQSLSPSPNNIDKE